MDKLRKLDKNEIVGHYIVQVQQLHQLESDHETCELFFILESGVRFFIPLERATGVYTDQLPEGCELFEHSDLSVILNVQIRDVLRLKPESEVFSESAFVLFENGYLISDVVWSPVGILQAGVLIHKPGEIDLTQLESVWTQRNN